MFFFPRCFKGFQVFDVFSGDFLALLKGLFRDYFFSRLLKQFQARAAFFVAAGCLRTLGDISKVSLCFSGVSF